MKRISLFLVFLVGCHGPAFVKSAVGRVIATARQREGTRYIDYVILRDDRFCDDMIATMPDEVKYLDVKIGDRWAIAHGVWKVKSDVEASFPSGFRGYVLVVRVEDNR